MISKDPEALNLLRNIVDAFDCREPLVFAEVCQNKSSGPSLAVWFHGAGASARPQRMKLKTSQLTDTPGPEPRPPKVVVLPEKPKTPMTTLRLLSPAYYRKFFLPPGQKDSPSSVIAAWAQLLDVKVASLTGGKSESMQGQQGETLVGHIRVPTALALRARVLSGHRALFCAVLDKAVQGDEVAWKKFPAGSTLEGYLRTAQASASQQGLPLVLRQGGKHDLGIVGGEVDTTEHASHFLLHDAPRDWDEHDVLQLLRDNHWGYPQVLSRKKSWQKQSPPVWVFKASIPHGSSELGSWTYADCDTCLTITKQEGHRRKEAQVATIQGSRKQWVDGALRKPVEPIAMECSSDAQEPPIVHESKAALKQKAERPRSRSRERKKQNERQKPATPEEMLLSQLGLSWRLIDKGGTGDCAYRAAAAAVADSQNKQLNEAQLLSEASKLRLLAVSYLTKHRSDFEDRWSHDPQDVIGWADNQPPETFEAYLRLIARREVWADNYQMLALAVRTGIPIITWSWNCDTQVWLRTVWAPWYKNGFAQGAKKQGAICLALRDKHYKVLQHTEAPGTVPQEWYRPNSLRMVPSRVLA